MMDVSGSMSDDKKEIVRLTAFWIDTWLRSQYAKVAVRYLIHDAQACEVDQDAFYHTRESGGTSISSAYRLCLAIIDKDYNPAEWNIYPFHFSDGDNWDADNASCVNLLADSILPQVNLFCYGEVSSARRHSDFADSMDRIKSGRERLVKTQIKDKDEIYNAVKAFLGKGR